MTTLLSEQPTSVFDIHRIEKYEEIYKEEDEYRNIDNSNDYFRNNQYYIGLSYYDKQYDNLLLSSSVTTRTFFNHNYSDVVDYLNNYTILLSNRVLNPEIMLLQISDDMIYNVVIKTFWIKIIQRHWKHVYRNKKIFINNYDSMVNYIRDREVGKNNTKIPSLIGMLSRYKELKY
jgi:hypothetical protein